MLKEEMPATDKQGARHTANDDWIKLLKFDLNHEIRYRVIVNKINIVSHSL